MTTRTRRIILLVILAFVLYSVVTSPTTSAGYVSTWFGWIANAVKSVGQFFHDLLH